MGLLQALRSLRPRLARPRLARPKTFLGFIPLQMGTEIIAATLFFNKLTGAYGLLAILTGFSLSPIQLSAYLYNLSILILLAICLPHIRRETPLPNLALAWAYAVDTLINAAYTATFAVSWYLASSTAAAAAAAASNGAVAAANLTVSAATATAPADDALASAAPLAFRDDEGAAAAQASPTATPTAGSGGWMGSHETAASLTLIVLVTVVRFYFCFVVMAHTRQALQRYGDHVVESAAAAGGALDDDDDADDGDDEDDDETKYSNGGEGKSERDAQGGKGESGTYDIDDEEVGLKSGTRSSRGRRRRRRARPSYGRPQQSAPAGPSSNNPFAPGSPAGEGWRGKLGRTLVKVGHNFWLGRQQDDDWARDVNSRFRSSAA